MKRCHLMSESLGKTVDFGILFGWPAKHPAAGGMDEERRAILTALTRKCELLLEPAHVRVLSGRSCSKAMPLNCTPACAFFPTTDMNSVVKASSEQADAFKGL